MIDVLDKLFQRKYGEDDGLTKITSSTGFSQAHKPRNKGRQGETWYNRGCWEDSFLSIYEFK